MSKRELINAIIQVNRTAAPEFLARFAESDLKAYLDRVCQVAHGKPMPRVITTVNADQQMSLA